MNNAANILFHCPHCRTSLSVPAQLAGVTGPCPQCSSQITAPLTNLIDPAVTPAPIASPHAAEPAVRAPAPRVEPLRSEQRDIASRRPEHNSFSVRLLRLGIPLVILGLLAFGLIHLSHYLKGNSLTQPAKKVTEKSLKSPLDESIVPVKPKAIVTNVTPTPVTTTSTTEPATPLTNAGINPPANAIKVKPLTELPEVAKEDEPLAGEIASRVLEQFLAASTFDERMMYIYTHRDLAELQQTVLATKWPTAQFTPGTQIKHPKERLIEFYYKVTFGENSYNFPIEVTFLLHQRGDDAPKIVLEPLLDSIGGRLRNFAKEPSTMPQDFYVIMDARVKCIDETIPEAESKFSFYLRAHTTGRDIATAYASNSSSVRAEFDNPLSGLKWKNPTPVILTLQWNSKVPNRPYLEVIEIKAKNWNP